MGVVVGGKNLSALLDSHHQLELGLGVLVGVALGVGLKLVAEVLVEGVVEVSSAAVTVRLLVDDAGVFLADFGNVDRQLGVSEVYEGDSAVLLLEVASSKEGVVLDIADRLINNLNHVNSGGCSSGVDSLLLSNGEIGGDSDYQILRFDFVHLKDLSHLSEVGCQDLDGAEVHLLTGVGYLVGGTAVLGLDHLGVKELAFLLVFLTTEGEIKDSGEVRGRVLEVAVDLGLGGVTEKTFSFSVSDHVAGSSV